MTTEHSEQAAAILTDWPPLIYGELPHDRNREKEERTPYSYDARHP